jgi:hypothetical protein
MVNVKSMKKYIGLFLPFLLMNGCLNLNVDNPGLPDLTDLNVRNDIFQTWFNITQSSTAASIALSSMADQTTTSYGDQGSRLSDEPRPEFSTGTRGVNVTKLYADLYQSLTYANDILALLAKGATFSEDDQRLDNDMLKAWARFMQGLSLGYLGLCFDRAVIVKEDTPTNYTTISPHADVMNAALASLDECITLCGKNSFTLPSAFIPGNTVSESLLAQLANSFAARILIYSPRNVDENNELQWNDILDYADEGIDLDFKVSTDPTNWLDTYKSYGTNVNGYVRVDHRIIHLMDPDYPSRWPSDGVSWDTSDGNDPGQATSSDARLDSDFEYMQNNIFDPARGYYHFSHYRCKRYDNWLVNQSGPSPIFLKEEIGLIKAEAMAETGNLTGAIAQVNSGSRVLRGTLPPLSADATKQEVLDAIFYERDIELMFTGMGISFFDMRRRDMLQKGTPLHFPIPFSEQDILKVTRYTFGGVSNADGVNTSDGGWF